VHISISLLLAEPDPIGDVAQPKHPRLAPVSVGQDRKKSLQLGLFNWVKHSGKETYSCGYAVTCQWH